MHLLMVCRVLAKLKVELITVMDLGLYGTPSTQAQNPADNSGILRYVRIEYAGYAFLPDKEING